MDLSLTKITYRIGSAGIVYIFPVIFAIINPIAAAIAIGTNMLKIIGNASYIVFITSGIYLPPFLKSV